jgi:hypothetical protein
MASKDAIDFLRKYGRKQMRGIPANDIISLFHAEMTQYVPSGKWVFSRVFIHSIVSRLLFSLFRIDNNPPHRLAVVPDAA